VIAVGATRIDQARSHYSNYGTGRDGHTLDVVAPGGDLGVDQNGDTYPDGVLQQTYKFACSGGEPNYTLFAYCFFNGTSMASPHVAGVAALMRTVKPGLTPAQVRDILTSTALDLGAPGYDLEYGYGLINAHRALLAIPQSDDFGEAIRIDRMPWSHSQDTTDATVAPDDPPMSCVRGGDPYAYDHTVWYELSLPTDSPPVSLSTFDSDYDTVLALCTGSRGSLHEEECNDDTGGSLQSAVIVGPVTSLTTYYIMVASSNGTRGGALGLSGDLLPTPTPTPLPQAKVKIGSGSVSPGGSLTVPLDALNIPDPGLGAVMVDIQYDNAVVDATACAADPGAKFDTKLCNIDFAPNVVRLTATKASCGLTGNAPLANLTFKALGQQGQVSPLNVTVVTFYDCNGANIPVSDQDGSITIGLNGDTDCDTDVDAVDCLYILQNVVGTRGCSNQWPPPAGTLYCPAADTQCDKDIDAVDALFCLQYVVGIRPSLQCSQ
jgi:hypothetical protein